MSNELALAGNMPLESMTMEQLQLMQNQILARQMQIVQRQLEAVKDELVKTRTELEITKHRVDNLDAVNIDGDLRFRLNAMIRKYAFKKGITFTAAWQDFTRYFNGAYGRNLGLLVTNLSDRMGRDVTRPEALERYGLLEDAIRVADKMINGR